MRYPDGHKQAVRAKIVEAASRALRRDGLAGVSIPALMKRAGLTHGGFYAHFTDRDELVAEAVLFGADETAHRVFEAPPDEPSVLAEYLSPSHVAHPELGCVLAALGTDGARQRAPVRRAFATAARGFLSLVQRRHRPNQRTLDDDSLRLAAQMIGAVVLARLVDDEPLATRLLAAAAQPR